MAEIKQVKVPDLGGDVAVDIIEVLIKSGDAVKKDQALIVVETEKATIEIPSPFEGIVQELKVKTGDKVQEGSLILTLSTSATDSEAKPASKAASTENQEQISKDVTAEKPQDYEATPSTTEEEREVVIPDLGGSANVDVIEVLVKAGDEIKENDPLITLEGEKATMEIPSPYTGTVSKVIIQLGDKVSADQPILTMQVRDKKPQKSVETKDKSAEKTALPLKEKPAEKKQETSPVLESNQKEVYAGPSVRRFARELGVDLSQVKGTGLKGRIQKEDVKAFVKQQLQSKNGSGLGITMAAMPDIDFTKFGEVEVQPLSKINKLAGANLHRNWVQIPHVTQFDEADITELEAFRQAEKKEAESQGFKLTPLVFIMKAVVAALKAYPRFNSSLDKTNENLIFKKYFHIGAAVDTPNGLVVAVIRDVDQKGFFELAKELAQVSEKARTKGLTLQEMQGSSFTISSLGGIGGTAFTPIVNLPDVAILGVSKAIMKPVYQDHEFVPRLMLPLSLSYDHRVIDGALGARFCHHLTTTLSDIRSLLL